MLDQFLAYCTHIKYEFLANYPLFIKWMLVFWAIYLVNNIFLKGKLNIFGIIPRRVIGLPGIIFSPFLHGSFNHLFLNSLMLIILGFFVLIQNPVYFYPISAFIVITTGALTWSAGRDCIHIGASGLIMGYWGYLMANTIAHPSNLAVVIGAICLYYFSYMFLNLFPTEKQVSWESHVFGFVTGIGAVYVIPIIYSQI
jgi:membrane associated rhomboid family serine protease